MVFWIVAAAVLVVLAALIWWHSGRAKPFRDYDRAISAGGAEGKSQAQVRRNETNGPRSL
jgi:hypothetical protein